MIELPAIIPVIGGTMVSEWLLLGVLTLVVGAVTIGAGLPLVFLFKGLDKTVANVKEDDGFKADVAALEKRQKEQVKEYSKLSPPDPIPSHDRPGWSVISTSLLVGLFLAFVGAAFSNDFFGGDNSFNYSVGFALVGIAATLAFLSRKRVQEVDAAEKQPLSGGAVWVILTGLFVIGLGIGVMMWVRTVGV